MDIAADIWSWIGIKATGTARIGRAPERPTTWRVHQGQLSHQPLRNLSFGRQPRCGHRVREPEVRRRAAKGGDLRS
jgi:hypothetical protein